jgi:hypothetical protein
VDTDKDPRRRKLGELKKARKEDRASSPPFPLALGEANPHGEAWLLDDRSAVAEVLAMKADDVPNVRKVKSPKEILHALWKQSERSEDSIMDLLAEIAARVDPDRCVHANETGFRGLMREVHKELRGLVEGEEHSSE